MKKYQILKQRNSGRVKEIGRRTVALQVPVEDLVAAAREGIKGLADRIGVELMERAIEVERMGLTEGPLRVGHKWGSQPGYAFWKLPQKLQGHIPSHRKPAKKKRVLNLLLIEFARHFLRHFRNGLRPFSRRLPKSGQVWGNHALSFPHLRRKWKGMKHHHRDVHFFCSFSSRRKWVKVL